jgi:hypothetical protein
MSLGWIAWGFAFMVKVKPGTSQDQHDEQDHKDDWDQAVSWHSAR